MGWLRRDVSHPDPRQPAQMGRLFATHIQEKLLSSKSTAQLRSLLDEESVPEEKRDEFDDALLLFAMFLVFIAARRRYPREVAEEILAGALAPVFSVGDEPGRYAVTARLDRYRKLCGVSPEPGKELAALTYCACTDLYDNDARDPLFTMPVTMWVTSYLKAFDDVFVKIGVAGV